MCVCVREIMLYNPVNECSSRLPTAASLNNRAEQIGPTDFVCLLRVHECTRKCAAGDGESVSAICVHSMSVCIEELHCMHKYNRYVCGYYMPTF